MLGIDRSYALLTPEMAAAHVANGSLVLDQCLFDGRHQPPNRVINLRNALDAGMTIRSYWSPNTDIGTSWNQTIAGIPDDIWAALLDMAVDYEEANRGIDWKTALGLVQAAGKGRLLYTNNDTWTLDGNKPWPADTRLWNADWGSDITKLLPHPFGGLVEGDPRIIGRQYASGTDEDLDIWVDVQPPKPKPQPYVTRLVEVFSDLSSWTLDVVPPPGVKP